MCKVCIECKISLEPDKFQKDSSSKDGKQSRCKVCQNKLNTIWRESHRLEHRAMNNRYYKENKEKVNARIKECRENNIEEYRLKAKLRAREQRKNLSPEKKAEILEKKRLHRIKTSAERKIYKAAYNKANPHINRTAAKMRKMSKKQRLPKWADLEKIREVYKNCPQGLQVDHIIPLHGKTVSGLHVHDNLQYLTPLENVQKSNKW